MYPLCSFLEATARPGTLLMVQIGLCGLEQDMQGRSKAVGDKAVGFTHSTQTGSPSAPVGTASQSFSATVFLLPRSPCTSAMPGKRVFPYAPLKPRLP